MNISQYFKPKSLVYTGKHSSVITKITHYVYDEKNLSIKHDFQPVPGFKSYIQVIGLSNVEQIQSLKQFFPIDALILEDILNVNQRNKIELIKDSIFGTFNIEYLLNRELKGDYMSIWMDSNTIITFHETEPVFLFPLEQLFNEHMELRSRTIDYLFFQILDIITDNHLDVYDQLDAEVNQFENEILETKNIEQEEFYLLRKFMLNLKNHVSPVLEHLNQIMNKKSSLFMEDNMPFYDDLRDHLVRLDSRLDRSRELMRHLLDLHMNNQSNKMNKIMATLTLFSAIFIPLSFLTGFFGMNFVHFGILQYEYAVIGFTILCASIIIFMVWFFKKKKWF
jgi:magnesium transporter